MKDFKDKIDNLDSTIKHYKVKEKKTKNNSKSDNGMKYVTQISIDVGAGIAVGAFLGYNLDKFFATKPLYFIIFMLLGMAGGFVNLLRNLK